MAPRERGQCTCARLRGPDAADGRGDGRASRGKSGVAPHRTRSSFLQVVRLLSHSGGHLGLSGGDLGVLLTSAAGQGREQLVRCLLAAGASVDTPSPVNGNTGLAKKNGYITYVNCLGLHCAVEGDQPDMIQLLLEADADLMSTNK